MKKLAHRLSIGEMFGLAQGDLDRVERVALPSSEGHVLYLFTCEDLLSEGHRLAIDDRCGTIGVYANGTILKETAVETVEICVLTAFALSFPFPVSEPQIQDLSLILWMKEHEREAASSPYEEHVMPSVYNLVAACNQKISTLGLVLVVADAPSQPSAVNERGGEKTRVVYMKALSPGV